MDITIRQTMKLQYRIIIREGIWEKSMKPMVAHILANQTMVQIGAL